MADSVYSRFNFDLTEALKQLNERKPRVALLQFPIGIKMDAPRILKELEAGTKDIGTRFIVSGENCWGGCDVDVSEAQAVGAEVIVHFAHAEFTKIDFPVIYVYVEDTKDLMPLVEQSKDLINDFQTIALVSSIQHVHDLEKIKAWYENQGKKVLVPEALGHAHITGHVVGCEYGGLKKIRDQVDAVVVLGNQFHSLGAALAVPNKPVILIDTYNEEARRMDEKRDQIIKQRAISIDKVKNAERVGIIIGVKVGQKFGAYRIIKEALEQQGKTVVVITMREMTPDKIFNFYNLEGFIELACPRIAVDDFERYKKPLITFREAMVVLGKLSWDDLLKDGFV